jgi:hypothetical protein
MGADGCQNGGYQVENHLQWAAAPYIREMLLCTMVSVRVRNG